MAAITTAALVWLFVALAAKSDAESTAEDLRSDLSTSSQEAQAQSEELGELSDQLEVALSTAGLNGSRWLAALSVSGSYSPGVSRLLALEALRRDRTPEARSALGSLILADPRLAAPIVRLEHDGAVWAVAVSPDGRVIATGSGDGTVGVWDRATGVQLAELRHDGAVLAIAFSPSGDNLLSASDDGSARIWSVESGEESVSDPAR